MKSVKVSWAKNIKAIGFDVDGTLYKMTPKIYNKLSLEVAKRAAEELGQDPREFSREHLMQRDKHGGNTKAVESYGLNGEEIYQKAFDEFAIEGQVERDKRLVEMIEKLKKKYKLFIISNGTGRQVERKLKVLGINHLDFEPRIYCYDEDWSKPDSAPFLSAINALELDPSEIVYIGDNEDIDIVGAKAVGLKTVMAGGESQKADLDVSDIYGLEGIFEL